MQRGCRRTAIRPPSRPREALTAGKRKLFRAKTGVRNSAKSSLRKSRKGLLGSQRGKNASKIAWVSKAVRPLRVIKCSKNVQKREFLRALFCKKKSSLCLVVLMQRQFKRKDSRIKTQRSQRRKVFCSWINTIAMRLCDFATFAFRYLYFRV